MIDFSSIISFFCVSLGPWCFLLRLATLRPIFLWSHGVSRGTQLCVPCFVDHGRLDAFHGTIHFSSSLCRVAVLVDTRLAYIVNLLFHLNTHFHVLLFLLTTRTSTCGLLVLQRRTHPFRALRVFGVLSRARLLWSVSCKTTLISRTPHQLDARRVAHHMFDQAQQCSFIVGSHQDSLEPQ